jgi:predicted 3-demethylubiquinone-9 3-methyltransferase (glyoxalase superfamily)
MSIKQRITPFLWFDRQAEEAAKFYVSIMAAMSQMKKINIAGLQAAHAGS